jgi:hypothetical protein
MGTSLLQPDVTLEFGWGGGIERSITLELERTIEKTCHAIVTESSLHC